MERNLNRPAELSGTFSIVAVDPETSACGAAVASRCRAVADLVAHVRAGIGAFCTQHWHNPAWGGDALDALSQGLLPEEAIAGILKGDGDLDKRQILIIDMRGRTLARNPANPDPAGIYWGAASGKNWAVAGNTLSGRSVLEAMAGAFESTQGTLADRLMAALWAGELAGGDHRGRLAAGIRMARTGVPGEWLTLKVDDSKDAVRDLLKEYLCLDHPARGPWRPNTPP